MSSQSTAVNSYLSRSHPSSPSSHAGNVAMSTRGSRRSPVPADGHRPSLVCLGKCHENARAHLVKARGRDKHLTSRAPVVIGGTRSVVSQDIGARPQKGGPMWSPDRGSHHLLREAAAQLETRHETTHDSHCRIPHSYDRVCCIPMAGDAWSTPSPHRLRRCRSGRQGPVGGRQ